jgi:hypothetical protein
MGTDGTVTNALAYNGMELITAIKSLYGRVNSKEGKIGSPFVS